MLNEQRVGDFLAALGERTPTPASGTATALTGALAAALTELAGRFAEDDDVLPLTGPRLLPALPAACVE